MSQSKRPYTKRSSAEEWTRRVAAWAHSGLDAESFVAREGAAYSAQTLRWWKHELPRRARGEGRVCSGSHASRRLGEVPVMPASGVRLARVKVSPAPSRASANAGLEVVLADGVVVRVGSDVDVERAAQMISALTHSSVRGSR